MTKLAKAAGLAGILVLLSAVTAWRPQAAEPGALGEGRAAVTDLDANSSAITYWVDEPDGRHVVTTVDVVFDRGSDTERHAIVRFSAVLQPGQSQQISIPRAIGEQAQVLRIRRLGDRIEVALVPESAV
ncbi:MAG TPA: hypothetical protein VKB42_18740 [Dongiaceae bacterium]|nr:hypothetical protein [Dongiaceae bacterium]